MIKVSFKLDVSFCKLMVGVIGLSATVGAVHYFSKKKNKQPDKNVSVYPNTEVSKDLSNDKLNLSTSRLASDSGKRINSEKQLIKNKCSSNYKEKSISCLDPCSNEIGSRIEQNVRTVLPAKSKKNGEDVSNGNAPEKTTNKENVLDCVTNESHLGSVLIDSKIDEKNLDLLRAPDSEELGVRSILDDNSYDNLDVEEKLIVKSNSSFEDTNFKKAGLKTFSTEKSANDSKFTRSKLSEKECMVNEFHSSVRNNCESLENYSTNKNLKHDKLNTTADISREEPRDIETNSRSNLSDNELVQILQNIITSFKCEDDKISSILGLLQSFNISKTNIRFIRFQFLQKIISKYKSSIRDTNSHNEKAKVFNKQEKNILESFPNIRVYLLRIIKTSFEKRATDNVIKNVCEKAFLGLDQTCKLVKFFTNQFEEIIEAVRETSDSKRNFLIQKEQLNKKLCSMI